MKDLSERIYALSILHLFNKRRMEFRDDLKKLSFTDGRIIIRKN